MAEKLQNWLQMHFVDQIFVTFLLPWFYFKHDKGREMTHFLQWLLYGFFKIVLPFFDHVFFS